jgi:hypothetical protein
MLSWKKNYLRNKIEFYPVNEDAARFVDPPSRASLSIPSWFTSVPRYGYGGQEPRIVAETGETNTTVRHCLPLIDAFSMGYMFQLRCDVQFTRGRYGIEATSPQRIEGLPDAFVYRSMDHDSAISTPWKNLDGYDPLQFGWMPSWSVRTPKGWSCLFIHPVNRADLPFYTIGGVIDTDGWGEAGQHPFLLKNNFEGVIPMGTPIVQIIPFKRESWSATILKDLVDEGTLNIMRRYRKIGGYYKNNIWSRKSFR